MSGATARKPASASAVSWWRHEYQDSGKPCQRTTSGPSPFSATCMRMPFVSTVRYLIAVIACSLASAISLPAQVDQDVSIRIAARRLESVDDDSGVRNLDDRRSRHDIAGNESLAPEDWREVEVAQLRPVDGAGAGARLPRRSAIGLRRGDDARLGAHRGGAHAIGHDLHARLAEPGALAVDRLAAAGGGASQRRPPALIQRPPPPPPPPPPDLAPLADVRPACRPGPP